MTSISVGHSTSAIARAIASHPKWMKWISTSGLVGFAQLPSGHRRLISLNNSYVKKTNDYYVVPLSLGLTDAPWRVAIFAPNGSYITSTGTGDMPTIGTPVVRIGVNAPSKAVVRIPVLKNTPGNILASTFAGWSDGHTGKVDRGMELTVEYRDVSSGTMKMAFRGMIYQIESGNVITITAYDRLMDLAQFSDQYQSTSYNRYTEYLSRTSIGESTYNFVASLSPGVIVACTAWSTYRIDCLSEQNSMTYGQNQYRYFIRHPLPSTGGYGPTQGNKIRQLSVKYWAYYTWTRLANHTVSISGKFILYRNGVAVAETGMVEFIHKTVSNSTNIQADGTLTINVDWTLDGSPSEYMVGAYVEGPPSNVGSSSLSSYNYKSGFSTVSSVYRSDNGSSWTQLTGEHPEIAINFDISSSVATSSVSTSGKNVYVQQAAIPTYSASYLSVIDKGIMIYLDYLISGAAGLANIVRDLIEWAGLTPDMVGSLDLGSTTFYTTSTYDFMTCVQEILKSGNFAVKASIDEPGKVYVRARHTVSETPAITFTTDPSASGEQIIVSHDLTAHWMAEKATQAYIAENATTSGLPIALETDDALMANSLAEIMQSPLRSVITDKTLGTHDLQATAAGGKMVQLHTNVFEGGITLAGYRLDVWDFTSSYCGGKPIGINVPEYGAQGTAIPTEIVIGDGVTQVSLNNIRTADRSEIANSMGLTADAISNSANTLPEAVYVFARLDTYETKDGISTPGSITSVAIMNVNGTIYTQSSGTYIRVVNDNAGYIHIAAIFPSSAQPSGYAPVDPIDRVAVTWGGVTRYAVFDNAKPALAGQSVHVDIRIKRA